MNKLIKQAFTLIELLVVIAIIGILSGLIVVSMSGVTQKANIAKAQIFSNSLRNSLMANLVSEWKFNGITADGGAVTTNDILDQWGEHNCSISGVAPTIKTSNNCFSGSCIYFNKNSDGYLSCGNLGSYASFTVNFWAKKDSGTDYNCFLDGNSLWTNGFHFWANGNTILTGVRDGTNAVDMTTSTFIPGINWNNITFVVDKGLNLQKLYLNGSLVNSGDITSITGNISINPFIIGYSQGNSAPNNEFKGFIDEVRFYGAAIPTSQIKEQYYAGLNSLLSSGQITKEDYQNRLVGIK
ncbi:MAG: LamG-like jellyroll fold domain-containing protein [Candidatus Paceibacterota bacterium]|jgi:prepilin-type N-terminal cleavage/methylation domain-containing protein